MAVSIYNIVEYFANEIKLVKRGENALNAGHVTNFTSDDSVGVVNAKVHSSMKNKLYDVEVRYNLTKYNLVGMFSILAV